VPTSDPWGNLQVHPISRLSSSGLPAPVASQSGVARQHGRHLKHLYYRDLKQLINTSTVGQLSIEQPHKTLADRRFPEFPISAKSSDKSKFFLFAYLIWEFSGLY